MERFRSISPESSNSAFSWRKTLRTRGSILNRDDKCNFLTSSLPSSMFSKEMEMKNLRKITSQNQIIEDVDCRHRYPIYKDLPPWSIGRSRSGSVQVNLLATKRKPFQKITRTHTSSAVFGRIQLNSLGKSTAATCKVDDAFANIWSQLAQLSEEDMLLQERLDCLALEIASMQRCVDRKCYLPAVAPTTTFVSHGEGEILTSPNLSSPSASLMSASQSNILAIAEESCEDEEDLEGNRKGREKGISNYLNLKNSAKGSCETSTGSCQSLADSEGSLFLGHLLPSCHNDQTTYPQLTDVQF